MILRIRLLPMKPLEHVEPILKLLMLGIVFFTICLFLAEWLFQQDGQIFQVISGLLAGFGGAFLMRVKTDTKTPPIDQPASATTTTVTQETVTADPKN